MERTNPLLTPAERDRLIEENLPLVRFVARTMQTGLPLACLDFEDLVGFGTLGLVQAADRFDPGQGGKFSSFAVSRIRGAILDAMRALDPVGRSFRQMARRIDATASAMSLDLGREPLAAEVREACAIDEDVFWKVRSIAAISQVSLDQPADDDNDRFIAVADDSSDVSSRLESQQLHSALTAAVGDLPDRERHIVALYYVEGLTMKEVARVLNLSETRVSQLLQQAYGRLRRNAGLAAAA